MERIDPTMGTTVFVYDALGNLVADYTYDPNGNLSSHTDARGTSRPRSRLREGEEPLIGLGRPGSPIRQRTLLP